MTAIETEITGLHRFSFRRREWGIVIVREDDYRLRRFGILEVVDLESDHHIGPVMRGEADEVWGVIEGRVEINCVDLRGGSPSADRETKLQLDSDDIEGVFIPFGVEFEIMATTATRLIRLTSHLDGSHAGDRGLPAQIKETSNSKESL